MVKIDLYLWKGHYPYEYIDSIKRFNETSFPPREYFNNRLTDTDISNADTNMRKIFGKHLIQTLWEPMMTCILNLM